MIDLVRNVYATDAGLTATDGTTGLTMQQVNWAWSVVGALCRLGIALVLMWQSFWGSSVMAMGAHRLWRDSAALCLTQR